MTKYKNYHYIEPFNSYLFGAVEKRADQYWENRLGYAKQTNRDLQNGMDKQKNEK